MPTDKSLIGDVLTGGTPSFQPLPKTRRTAASIASEADVLNRQTEWLHADASELRRSAQIHELEEQQTIEAAKSGRELLTHLSDHGLSWTDIARTVGVSIPAIQKWRRGAGITGENRLRLARVAALLVILERYLISEPCSWLEMPILREAAVTSMDLLEADRYDLVLELARGEVATGERASILDEFAPDWRDSKVDTAFEVVMSSDGRLSIQTKA